MKSLIKKQVEFYKNNPGNLALDVVSLVPAVRGIRTGYQVYKAAKASHAIGMNKGSSMLMRNYKDVIGQLKVHAKKSELDFKKIKNPTKNEKIAQTMSQKNYYKAMVQHGERTQKELKGLSRKTTKFILKDPTTRIGYANVIGGVGTSAGLQTLLSGTATDRYRNRNK
jgi:hypothetical protein